MKDAEKTIGTILDKQSIVYISSVDEDGFPTRTALEEKTYYNNLK